MVTGVGVVQPAAPASAPGIDYLGRIVPWAVGLPCTVGLLSRRGVVQVVEAWSQAQGLLPLVWPPRQRVRAANFRLGGLELGEVVGHWAEAGGKVVQVWTARTNWTPRQRVCALEVF